MSIYLDEKNPGKHKPFEDASPDVVTYVRYLEVIAGKSANEIEESMKWVTRKFYPSTRSNPRLFTFGYTSINLAFYRKNNTNVYLRVITKCYTR